MTHQAILDANGLDLDHEQASLSGGTLVVRTPVDGAELARLKTHDADEVRRMIAQGVEAFGAWRSVPAPRRGELVRLLGEELRAEKENLGQLVSLESGKILQEGLGEVQEMIDICDFAVGLSRQLYGLTIASERPGIICERAGIPSASAASSPLSISPSLPGVGIRRWLWSAAIR